MIRSWASAFLLGLLPLAQAATVTVNPNVLVGTSQLKRGDTQTQVYWEKGNATAVAWAKGLLSPVLRIHNQSIMGWGAGPVLSPAAEGTNVLRNPGFENGLEGWTKRKVTGKDGYGHAYPTSIVQEVSSQVAHTGSRNFSMSDPLNHPFWGWLETTVEGCAEGAYSAKVWAKASGSLPDAKLQSRGLFLRRGHRSRR